jgi:excisionase family DNA binding protein
MRFPEGSTPTAPAPGLVSPCVAARTLGVSTSTVRRWIAEGRLTASRTPGGHRRVSLIELRRAVLSSTHPARVLSPPLPEGPLPALALILQRTPALASAAAGLTYAAGFGGWFARPESRAVLARWLVCSSRAAADGRPAGAVMATTDMFVQARRTASLEECQIFTERLSVLVLRELQRTPGGHDEHDRACALLAAMRHTLAISEDRLQAPRLSRELPAPTEQISA